MRRQFTSVCLSAVLILTATTPTSRLVAAPGSIPSVLLEGTVVTMNAARDVIRNGRVLVREGRIAAVWQGAVPPDGVDLTGAVRAPLGPRAHIYPGLINLHDHQAPAARADAAGDGRGAKLVWSPLSNLLLYGRTAAVYDALAAGVLVALGTDWSPSGSPNLLTELKVADRVLRDRSLLGDRRHIVPSSPRDALWRIAAWPSARSTSFSSRW